MFTSLFLTILVTVASAEFVVYTGFIVDNFCIQRCKGKSDGSSCALDGTNTYTAPAEHSIHCLVDPPPCVASGYSVVEKSAEGFYEPKYTLNDSGNTMALDYMNTLSKTRTNVMVTVVGTVNNGDSSCNPATSTNGVPAKCIEAISVLSGSRRLSDRHHRTPSLNLTSKHY